VRAALDLLVGEEGEKPLDLIDPGWQQRLGAVQRLNLRLLIDAQHHVAHHALD